MIKLIYGTGIVVGATLTFFSTRTLKQLRRELAQARLLQEQMEEDHITLVRNVIETNNALERIRNATQSSD